MVDKKNSKWGQPAVMDGASWAQRLSDPGSSVDEKF